MRAFIAISLPTETKNNLSKIQDRLKTALPKISWVKPINLHLTLKFLGEISPKQLKDIRQVTTEIAKDTPEFKIKLETLGIFPNIPSARIIWVGTNQLPSELKILVDRIETRIAELGKPKEERPFSAHITIARIKSNIDSSILENQINKINSEIGCQDLGFDVKGITLFESTLGSQGPTYTVIEEANFKII